MVRRAIRAPNAFLLGPRKALQKHSKEGASSGTPNNSRKNNDVTGSARQYRCGPRHSVASAATRFQFADAALRKPHPTATKPAATRNAFGPEVLEHRLRQEQMLVISFLAEN